MASSTFCDSAKDKDLKLSVVDLFDHLDLWMTDPEERQYVKKFGNLIPFDSTHRDFMESMKRFGSFLEPVIGSVSSEKDLYELTLKQREQWSFVRPTGPFDASVAVRGVEYELEDRLGISIPNKTRYTLVRARWLPPSEKVGKIRNFPHAVTVSVESVYEDGSVNDVGTVAVFDGTRWRHPNHVRDRLHLAGYLAGTALAAWYSVRDSWSVRLRSESGASVLLLTDPTGLRSLFRDRDVAPGKTRRDALLHWVSEHWRKKRHSDEDLSFVRSHMRGSSKFLWAGLTCDVRPSSEEIVSSNRLDLDRSRDLQLSE